MTLYRNGVDRRRCRDIRGGVKQLGLARQALGAHAKARTVRLRNLMLEDFQLLPQHPCKPVLFERERLQRIGLDGKIRGCRKQAELRALLKRSQAFYTRTTNTLWLPNLS